MDEFEEKLDVEHDKKKLWKQLSNSWVHTTGFAVKVVEITGEESQLPSWCLILPIELEQTDLSAIDDLNKYLSDFRSILRKSIDLYQNESRNLS